MSYHLSNHVLYALRFSFSVQLPLVLTILNYAIFGIFLRDLI